MKDIIAGYSRAQAVSDRVLIDATEIAKDAGFRVPVALTSTVYDRYVEVPRGIIGQDAGGRLWDILWMLRLAMWKRDRDTEVTFHVLVRNNNFRANRVPLKAICGPGDDLEPVITIMLPHED